VVNIGTQNMVEGSAGSIFFFVILDLLNFDRLQNL